MFRSVEVLAHLCFLCVCMERHLLVNLFLNVLCLTILLMELLLKLYFSSFLLLVYKIKLFFCVLFLYSKTSLQFNVCNITFCYFLCLRIFNVNDYIICIRGSFTYSFRCLCFLFLFLPYLTGHKL